MGIIKNFIWTIVLLVAVGTTAMAQNSATTPKSDKDKLVELAKKYEDVKGVDSFVCVKGKGLETIKLFLRSQFEKDFLKGINIIIIIDYKEAKPEVAAEIIKQIKQVGQNFQQMELPEETVEGKNVQNFFKTNPANEDEITEMMLIMEDDEDKSFMYFGGVFGDTPSKSKK